MVVVARQERSELPHHLTPLLELQDFMAALAALAGEQILTAPPPDLSLVYLVEELSITLQQAVVVVQTGCMKQVKVQHIALVHLLVQTVSMAGVVVVVRVPLAIQQLTDLQLQTLPSREQMVELVERVPL
jgi:hypothetical protein